VVCSGPRRARREKGNEQIMPSTRRLLHLIAILGFGLAPSLAQAQTYPDRPVKLILPYTPGSPNDVIARFIAPHLSSRLRQSIVIDNRPGGGTSIGVKAVMASESDGYTLLYSNSPTHLIAPLVNKGFSYDPIKDFTPIAPVGTSSLVLVISPDVPAKTVQEFVAYAKANPGKLNFGFGQGTLPQLVGEMFKLASGIDVPSIPYRGGAQAVTDILGGRIQMNFGTPSTLIPLIRDGKLRPLAITSPERHRDLPDVPTMIESGLPGVTAVTYYGFFGPAGTRAEAVPGLNREVNDALKSPELRASMSKVGFEPHSATAEEFAKLLASEQQKWVPIVRSTGFQME
jgi:tripartite-type tricarboxylate transporter receptor subunit TctC